MLMQVAAANHEAKESAACGGGGMGSFHHGTDSRVEERCENCGAEFAANLEKLEHVVTGCPGPAPRREEVPSRLADGGKLPAHPQGGMSTADGSPDFAASAAEVCAAAPAAASDPRAQARSSIPFAQPRGRPQLGCDIGGRRPRLHSGELSAAAAAATIPFQENTMVEEARSATPIADGVEGPSPAAAKDTPGRPLADAIDTPGPAAAATDSAGPAAFAAANSAVAAADAVSDSVGGPGGLDVSMTQVREVHPPVIQSEHRAVE
jgi:hypothetical protein